MVTVLHSTRHGVESSHSRTCRPDFANQTHEIETVAVPVHRVHVVLANAIHRTYHWGDYQNLLVDAVKYRYPGISTGTGREQQTAAWRLVRAICWQRRAHVPVSRFAVAEGLCVTDQV